MLFVWFFCRYGFKLDKDDKWNRRWLLNKTKCIRSVNISCRVQNTEVNQVCHKMCSTFFGKLSFVPFSVFCARSSNVFGRAGTILLWTNFFICSDCIIKTPEWVGRLRQLLVRAKSFILALSPTNDLRKRVRAGNHEYCCPAHWNRGQCLSHHRSYFRKQASRPILVLGLRHYFNQASSSVGRVTVYTSEGSNPRSAKKISIYLNDELNQKVNTKKNNKNNSSSNSLVFGQWPQTIIFIEKNPEWTKGSMTRETME